MDPLSITGVVLSTGTAALKVATTLHQFWKGTEEVDENVGGLCSGIKQVKTVCSLIDKQLNLLPKSQTEDPDYAELSEEIETQLSACLAVIHKVDSKLDAVRENKTGIAKQAYRQWRLNLSQADISECRLKISNGVQNLQLSLQLVSLQAIHLAPRVANQSLLDKLDEIQNLVAAEGLDKRLLKCAGTFVTKGTSLYASSVASSMGVRHNEAPPKAIATWLDQLDTLRLTSTTNSAAQRREDELDSINTPESSVSSLDADPKADSLSQNESSDTTEETAQALETADEESTAISESAHLANKSVHGDFDDVEDEFVSDMAQTALASGKTSYESKDFSQAETMFEECLSLLQKLPQRLRQEFDLDEVHLRLALCAFHNHDLHAAEAALFSALARETDSHAETKFEVGFSLAIVYVRLGKYDLARITCQNVYQGRRRLLGKNDELCHDTLALFARIHELQDLTTRAAVIREMIDVESRAAFCQRYENLSYEVQTRKESEAAKPLIIEDQPVVEESSKPKRKRYVWSVPLKKSSDHCLTVSKQSTLVACAAFGMSSSQYDAQLDLLSFSDGSMVRTLVARNETQPRSLRFNDSGDKLASGHGGYWRDSTAGKSTTKKFRPLRINIWNVKTGYILNHLTIPVKQTNLRFRSQALRFCANDTRLVFAYEPEEKARAEKGGYNTGIMVVHSDTGQVLWQFDNDRCNLAVDPDNDSRVAMWSGGNVLLLNILNDEFQVQEFDIKDAQYALPSSQNSVRIIHKDGKVKLWKHGDSAIQKIDLAKVWEPPTRLGIGCVYYHQDLTYAVRTLEGNTLLLAMPGLGQKVVVRTTNDESTISKWRLSHDGKHLLCLEETVPKTLWFISGTKYKLVMHDLQEQPRIEFDPIKARS